MKSLARWGLALALCSATWPAEAAGLYFSDRGVRPLGRGGAFVAGADDLGAIYYNPAGIVDAQSQVLFDASWLRFSSDFTRAARVPQTDPNTGVVGGYATRRYPTVHGTSPILPIPTLAGSYAINKDLVIAGGVYAPYAAITSYPEKVDGQPAASRYGLLSLDGSALAILGAWIAWRPIPELQIGGGPTFLTGNFQSSVMFGACPPNKLACAAEQPDYDAKGQLTVGTIFAPSATLGLIATPTKKVRVGLAYQHGYSVDSPAKFRTRLPSSPLFDQATVDGESAHVSFKLPWVARVGVEARPTDTTRVELAYVFEKWSVHDRITLTPDDTTLNNVAVFPPSYRLSQISMERGFKDAWSVRLGGEQAVTIKRYRLDLRAGVAYEKSAVPAENLSVLTVDMDKVTVAVGGGIHIGSRWRFDGLVALVFPKTVDVDPAEARIFKINPVRANRQTDPSGKPTDDVAINGGEYRAQALVLGIGLRYQFDGPKAAPPPAPVAEDLSPGGDDLDLRRDAVALGVALDHVAEPRAAQRRDGGVEAIAPRRAAQRLARPPGRDERVDGEPPAALARGDERREDRALSSLLLERHARSIVDGEPSGARAQRQPRRASARRERRQPRRERRSIGRDTQRAPERAKRRERPRAVDPLAAGERGQEAGHEPPVPLAHQHGRELGGQPLHEAHERAD